MKENYSISFNHSSEGLEMTIRDEKSFMEFITIKISPEEFLKGLGRVMSRPCEVTLKNMDKIGKKRKIEILTFEVENVYDKKYAIEKAEEIAKTRFKDNIYRINSFNSSDSFFTDNGKGYAKTTVIIWE
jgi:hypothetical protein